MNISNTNSIDQEQNSEKHLNCVAASSGIYSRAKNVLAIQMALTLGGGLVAAILPAAFPSIKPWTVTVSFGIALLDALFLERLQSRLKRQGALVQELFDCELLGIRWRKLKTGCTAPESEMIAEESAAFRRSCPDDSKIRNWYPPVVSQVPLPLARLICQRANCWWDAKLRRKYSFSLHVVLWLIAITVLIIGLKTPQSLGQLAAAVIAPLSPALLWGIREIRKQNEAAEALDRMRLEIENVWEQAVADRLSQDELDRFSQQVQDEIFERRARNPLIFNWINSLVRTSQEPSMNAKAKEMVAAVLSAKEFSRREAQ